MSEGNRRRVALVTGGSGGIGLAVAKALASTGHDVAITARDPEKGADAVAEIQALGARAHAVQMDVCNADDVNEAVAAIGAVLGAPLVVVNNAGVAGAKPFHALTVEDWDLSMDVNARGAFLVTQACLPAMVHNEWGRIVNVASTAGLEGVQARDDRPDALPRARVRAQGHHGQLRLPGLRGDGDDAALDREHRA